jgi:kinesin family protein C1
MSSSKLPLRDVSASSSRLNTGLKITKPSAKRPKHTTGRSSFTFDKNRILKTRSNIPQVAFPSDMTATLITNIKSHATCSRDEIIKEKQEKQNYVYKLNSEIWKVKTEIPDMNLQIEKVTSKLTSARSSFQILECKIKNLQSAKAERIKHLKESLGVFEKNKRISFEKKTAQLEQNYYEKATKMIQRRITDFQGQEKKLLHQIAILRSTIEDFSDTILRESKKEVENELRSEIKTIQAEQATVVGTMRKDIELGTNEIESLEQSIETLAAQYETKTQPELIAQQEKSIEVSKELARVELVEQKVYDVLSSLNKSKENECNKLLELKEKMRQFEQETNGFNLAIKEEEQYRRFLHNQLQEMKGNIRVFCRIKPERNQKTFAHRIQSMFENPDVKESLIITEPANATYSQTKPANRSLNSTSKPRSFTFSFDKVFDEISSNGDIFEEISQLVQSSLDGFNVCIFTYGQTGSGKTFTMSNPNDGLIPRSMTLMFERVRMLESISIHYQLYGQFFEIYSDSINDLIDEKYHSEDSETIFTNSEPTEVKMIKLESADQIEKLLKHAGARRATASTMANDVSSRSHSIFKVHVTKYDEASKENVILGTLNLVDLAGSERLAHSQVTGVRLKETLAINKSLSALGDVIASVKSKSNHVPYRNSKLTYVLKDSLGGRSKTLMFVNISCVTSHFNESLSSLRFASKVNSTELRR